MQFKNEAVKWVRNWFSENGANSPAIVGISGGKDSSVVAALCALALGKDRVFGVLMPNGEQRDIDYSEELVEFLSIPHVKINIRESYLSIIENISKNTKLPLNDVATLNTPARIRMTYLYAIGACLNGRVANTCNLSEDYVGYSTKFGDSAGDFCPLGKLTVTEVKSLGRELGLPEKFIEKTPEDGLCGKSDEDNLGFTYDVLDRYIRTGICEDNAVREKIDKMNKASVHKLLPMPVFSANH